MVNPIPITLLILMLVLLSLRVRTNSLMFTARWFTGVFFVAGILYAFSESANVATDANELRICLLPSSSIIMMILFAMLGAKMLGS